MGWLEAMALIAVGLMIGAAGVAGGLWASSAAGRTTSRARGPFLLGVMAGVMVGMALTAKRRGLNDLGASALKTLLPPLRAGIGPAVFGVGARALTVAGSVVRRVTGIAAGLPPTR